MKIQPITNYCYNNNSIQYAKAKSSSSINFNGIGISLVVLAAREGIGGIKGYKKVKYIEELQTHLKSSFNDNYIKGVAALCKTPDIFFDSEHEGWTSWSDFFTCFRNGAQDLKYIPELRFSALDKIEDIADNSYTNIQLKKDLINSFFENGHEISQLLVKKFAQLNDSVYSTFKVEIIDKCFSSPIYNSIRKRRLDHNSHTMLYDYEIAKTPCHDDYIFPGHLDKKIERAYNNLKMLATLDKNIYTSYYSRIRPMIEYHKQVLHDYAYKTNVHPVDVPSHKKQQKYCENNLKLL